MRPTRQPFGLVAAVLLLAATVLAAPAMTSAQNRQPAQEEYPGTFLQVAALACPPAYAGDAYAGDCVEPLPGLTFGLDDDATDGPSDIADNRTTDADGVALWEDLGPGGYALIDGPSGETAVDRLAVACVVEADPARPLPVEDLGNGVVRFAVAEAVVAADEDIFCAWYGAPPADSEATPPADTADFPVYAVTCDEDPGEVPNPIGQQYPPDGCVPAEGVAIAAATEDGTPLDTCATDDRGFCTVAVPIETPIVLTQDPATAPDGYAPREGSLAEEFRGEFSAAVFVNLPAGTPPAQGTVGSFDVRALACPTDYDGVDYASDCTAPREGVTFALDGPVLAEPETGADGAVSFGAVELGSYGLAELEPDPDDGSVVSCSVAPAFAGGIDIEYLDAGGIRAELTVPDATVTCSWYTIPGAAGVERPGVLLLVDWSCPDAAETELLVGEPGNEDQVTGNYCLPVPTETPPTTFTLTNEETGEATQVETSRTGDPAEPIAVEPGAYTLTENASGASASLEIFAGERTIVRANLAA